MTASHSIENKTRKPSELDKRCDDYVRALAELNPILGQDMGIDGAAGKLPDYSPAGIAAEVQLGQNLLRWVRDPENQVEFDDIDRVTAAALENRLALDEELYTAGEFERTLNNLASPLQEVRDSFDQLPKRTEADWSRIRDQSASVPGALRQFQESLAYAAAKNQVAPRRQIVEGIKQARAAASISNPLSTFAILLDDSPRTDKTTTHLEDAANEAAKAYGILADWLESQLLPIAPAEDGVGRERYQRFSELFVGTKVDLDETYEWGLEELARLETEQSKLARTMYGAGTSVNSALDRLNNDPEATIYGKTELQQWMQQTADTAIRELNGTEFEIPRELETIECMLAPSGNGGIYYTGPSEDYSRPGRMWWSVPAEVDRFHAWQERTTVFHEGAPGHHLQIGLAMASPYVPNLWRKTIAWNSGHGEGWALYAEQLMVELGYQQHPADLMGVLDAERLRTARVVLDIGVHLGKNTPTGHGQWDATYAGQFLRENVAMGEKFREFELNRYLGWPGQAPSYKIGHRLWQQLRTEYVQTLPTGNSAESKRRQFHTVALNLGNLPMSTLRDALLGTMA